LSVAGAHRRARAWFCVAVALVTGAGCAPTNHGDTLARIRARGTLRWGGDVQGGEPYAFQDPADSTRLIGFEVELADALARQLGVRAEFVQNDWHTLIPSLERGDFDMIMNGLEVTPARAGRVSFTQPYYAFDELVVMRRGAPPVAALSDLRGKRVGTLANSLAYELLVATPGIDVVLYEGVEEPYTDLEEQRLDAVVLDNIIARRYGLSRAALRAVGTAGEGIYAIAVRPSDASLLVALNAALVSVSASGELQRILERWNLWDARQSQVASAAGTATVRAPRARMSIGQLSLFLRATGVTVVISVLSMGLAIAGGLGLSLSRRYGGRLLRAAAGTYVEVFRGTPLLLQLYVLYYGLAPLVALDAFTAAVVGLGLNYAAYEAEIYRAGFAAVPIGQSEAGLALGMSRRVVLRRIVLPQALRIALPGMTNDFIALLKDSSLVSVITVVELTKQMTITAVDVRGWLGPGLLCATLYLGLSFPLSRLARRLERRLVPVPA
jgi:polar amino acid transport system permease protein/polar amino acid transport system substrate-binding protein